MKYLSLTIAFILCLTSSCIYSTTDTSIPRVTFTKGMDDDYCIRHFDKHADHVMDIEVELDINKYQIAAYMVESSNSFFFVAVPTEDEEERPDVDYSYSESTHFHNYYLVFKDKKLLYWGFIYDMNRSEDPLIRAIGKEIHQYDK